MSYSVSMGADGLDGHFYEFTITGVIPN